MAKIQQWSGTVKDALIEGQWQAASMIACLVTVDTQMGTGHWEIQDWKILQQARHAVSDYGINSEPAQQMLGWIFQADINCDFDCKNLARLLLTPSQYML